MSFDGIGWHDWLRGVDGAQNLVEHAFRLCKEMGFPTGAEMCIHGRNKHVLRQTVKHLGELGCGSLKTVPVSDIGAWHENGYGEAISIPDLFRLYLDYIPYYYEDGMPLRLFWSGLWQQRRQR